MRIAIAGCPRAGKTTLAKRLAREIGCTPFHADDLIATHEWSAASAEIAQRMCKPGPWLLEGVSVIRALRKALDRSSAKPCDRLLWMATPYKGQQLSPGQQRMFEADRKRFADIRAELVRRGVEIVTADDAPAARVQPRAQPQRVAAPAQPKSDAAEPVVAWLETDRWADFDGRGF